MGQDRSVEGICSLHHKAEEEPYYECIRQLLWVHMQQTEQQSTEKSSLPFAQKTIAGEQDAAGKYFFQKGWDHCDRNHGKDQA